MSNRLAGETSPYLLQHADQPVHWWPWCDEALACARREDKPILLSIGYSACHWCHVMAHESFENADTAALMNSHFINIKVDREERPDLDHIYQAAHQLLARRAGGWPLTMFLTPDGTPFLGGTYFPPVSRYGRVAFPELLQQVVGFYERKRSSIDEQNEVVRQALTQHFGGMAGSHVLPGGEVMDALADDLARIFDETEGGFGRAPKFPHCSDLNFLWRRYTILGDQRAGHMVLLSLRRMAEGGLYDQLGGGFFRYSVDDRWEIPHFEKMLYDNGPLLELMAEASLNTGDALFTRVVDDTVGWLLREMRAPGGCFHSSLDADSEHEEGRYYVWSRDAVQDALAPSGVTAAFLHWGLDLPANFEHRAWHLRVSVDEATLAARLDHRPEPLSAVLDDARQRLLQTRMLRVRPGVDDKVLTSWNALAIQGLARAGRLLAREAWIDAACAAVDGLRETMWQDGRLRACAKQGAARLDAYLDDHAFLLAALLELMQARFRLADLRFAESLADALLEAFEDPGAGGFFFTRHDHERLILRPRSGQDQVLPSGNAIAASALLRLGHVLGRTDWMAASERAVCAYAPVLRDSAQGYASLMPALSETLVPPTLVFIHGPAAQLSPWRAASLGMHRPDRIFLFLPQELGELPEALRRPASEEVQAWVCQGVQCLAPVDSLDGLRDALDGVV